MQFFEAWRNLKFDPTKDDVEEFMTNVKNLAATLEFNQEAQIMVIKSNMPRDVSGLCMQYSELDKLKKFLIELFENPRMKFEVPSLAPAAETSAFSMGEYVNNDVVSATIGDIGKLKNEISTLQCKVRRMTSQDTRSKPNSKLWKPEVTPPRRRGGNFRGKRGRQNDSGRQAGNNTGTKITVVILEVSMVEISQRTVVVIVSHLAIEAKIIATLVETKEIEVEAEEDLTPAQMSEGLE